MTRDRENATLFQLRWSFSNLRLRLARSLLTVFGIAVAVALLVGVASFSNGYRSSLQQSIDHLGFEVLVTAKGCPYEAATLFLRGGNIPMYLDEGVCDVVTSDPAVLRSTRLFMQAVKARSGDHLFLGVDESYLELKPWMELQAGRWLGEDDAFEVVLGYNVALEHGWNPGDRIEVGSLPRSLQVVGVLDRLGSQEDGTIFVPLGAAQKLFDRKDQLTGIGIKVRDFDLLPAYLERMYDLPAVQIVTMSQAQTIILNFLTTANRLLTVVGLLTAVVAGLALLNTLLMSLLERRRELAVLRALGARSAFLFLAVVLEALLLCFLGSVLGVGAAGLGARGVEAFLRDLLPFTPEGDLLRVKPLTAALAVAGAVACGFACSIYPAVRAAGMKPIRVLRATE